MIQTGTSARRPLVAARRVVVLLVVVALVGLPGIALTSFCVGSACAATSESVSTVPFCSLRAPLRSAIVRGFRDGRSPNVVAVTGPTAVVDESSTWTSTESADERVPVVFSGRGVEPGSSVQSNVGLVDISSTIAEVMGFERDHPEVRAGGIIESVAAGDPPRLVLEVVWHGVDSELLERRSEAWPTLGRLLNAGTGTLDARVGFAPHDTAAVTTTIGTGGYPAQHGITGELVRNDEGEVARAWGRRSPGSVIAGLGDQLDERFNQRPEIGLVGLSQSERGLIGGNWFVRADRDAVRISRGASPDAQASEAIRLLNGGSFGRDDVPDLLAVTMSGELLALDAALERLVDAADRATSGSFAVVVTSTGTSARNGDAVSVGDVVRRVEGEIPGHTDVVAAAASSGLFLDQKALAASKVSDDEVIDALRDVETPSGQPVFADVFPGLAVSFARYCDG